VRDASEHVDEQIFKAVESGRLTSHIAYNITPKRLIRIHETPWQHAPIFMLHFDPETRIVSFWDEEIPILVVLAEIERILPLADAALLQPASPFGP
jgi:hypothetical protein